jgi:hypothetical protein
MLVTPASLPPASKVSATTWEVVGSLVQIGPASDSGGWACGLAAVPLVGVAAAGATGLADGVAVLPAEAPGAVAGGADVSGRREYCVEVATPVAAGTVSLQAQSNPATAARRACARWRRESCPIWAQG